MHVLKGGDAVFGYTPLLLWTVILIGLALSMDAFSLGIGLGAQGLRWRDVGRLSLIISIFHLMLPLFGVWIGDVLYAHFGDIVQKITAVVMMFLGSQMIIKSIQYEVGIEPPPFRAHLLQLVGFAFGVSVDALSVGLTLGTLGMTPVVPAAIFAMLSGALSIAGLYIGRQVNGRLGRYGQVAGGAVLAFLGLKFFW